MENTSYPVTYNPASNASRINHVPMPTNFLPYSVPSLQQPQQPYSPYMQQLPHQSQLPMHFYPMHPFPGSFPTHNFTLIPIRQPLMPVNQFFSAPPCPSPIPPPVYADPPPSTPTSSRIAMHNASLNASFGATSFNNTSVRFNPLAGGRSRDHSLLFDQSTNSADLSFQQPFIDPHEMANNLDLISYCFSELCRKQLTEQELVTKVTRSRKFKRFGKSNLPSAISIILNTFPYFISRTVILKTCSADLQPFSKTIWKADKNFQKPRGSKMNATMFEIPERVSNGGEVLSVLGDIASLNLDENKPPTSIGSMEKILEGVKV
ncbi:hypothetical protein PRIPAC_75853 [Pristionchus pacificus]|uniref:Uncharacterized protein n=1 Tax=Pristionchus pacificus TaxID=54126 RepID=A0A2A6CSS5_PRIPA|nr:hypothetical protein PRIPAC_75853 [Pristionchus pacificus]|eukprot:PDM81189.1 hypothetical protein PRIPAC_36192 [Pristionchus pacificus]